MTQEGSGCPLIGEQGFFVNMAVIGENTSGKSTFLNAVFGDILAETDIGTCTKNIIRFYESSDAKSNADVLNKVIKTNEISDEKLNDDLNKLNKFQKKNFAAKWVLSWMDKVPKPQFEGASQPVVESGLIPRKGEFDNIFSIVDFPGFNDKLDATIFSELSKQCKEFDFIFYLMDCEKCLRDIAAQEIFDKTMKILQPILQKSHTKLIILFNKYDLVTIRDKAKEFIVKQRNIINNKLLNEYIIPNDKFKFFNISTNNLLIQRVLSRQDDEFVSKHGDIMDAVYVYCSQFLSGMEIKKFKRKQISMKKRLQLLYNATTRRQAQLLQLSNTNETGTDDGSSMYDDDIDEPGSTNKSDPDNMDIELKELEDEDEDESDDDIEDESEDLKQVLEFLQSLRSVTVMKEKAESYLRNLKINSFDALVEFFVCVFCLTRSNHNNSGIVNIYKNNNKKHHVLGRLMQNKLEDMTKYMNNNIELSKKCVLYSLSQLQYCLDSSVKNLFSLHNYIEYLTLNGYLNSTMVDELKNFIDLKQNNKYYSKVGKAFTNSLINNYANNDGKQNLISVEVLINDIFKHFEKNEDKSKLLSILLSYYENCNYQNDIIRCRAIDLMQYHFDMVVLRKLFNYKEYERLCSKHIKSQDDTFGLLIAQLRSVIM